MTANNSPPFPDLTHPAGWLALAAVLALLLISYTLAQLFDDSQNSEKSNSDG